MSDYKERYESDHEFVVKTFRDYECVELSGVGLQIETQLKAVEKNLEHNLFLIYQPSSRAFRLAGVHHQEGTEPKPFFFVVFCMSRMPGCCGIIILHDFTILGSYSRKGLGTLVNMLAQWRAHDTRYTRLVATDTFMSHPYSHKIFQNQEWQEVPSDFLNRRTNNTVRIYYKDDLGRIIHDKPRLQVKVAPEGA
jgi:hypothetical protein